MNLRSGGTSFREQLGQRATSAALILGVHLGLFVALAATKPAFVQALVNPPIQVDFVEEAARPPENWQPPAPEMLPVTPRAIAPETVINVPLQASEHAITVVPQTAAPPPPAGTAGPAPKLVSGVEYLKPPVPRYPPASRKQREQGVVVLKVLIDPQGHAAQIDVHQTSGFARLDQAAREAVKHAAFKPYVEDGHSQAAFVLIPIEFSLNSLTARG